MGTDRITFWRPLKKGEKIWAYCKNPLVTLRTPSKEIPFHVCALSILCVRAPKMRKSYPCPKELTIPYRKHSHKGKFTRVREVFSLSCVWLFATPWTEAHQAPLSMGFSWQEYWSGLPFPSPGDLSDPGVELVPPALQADSLPLNHQGSAPSVRRAVQNVSGEAALCCTWGHLEVGSRIAADCAQKSASQRGLKLSSFRETSHLCPPCQSFLEPLC